MTSPLDSPARREMRLLRGALVLVVGMAWWWILSGAGMEMNAFEMTRHSRMDMPAAGPSYWDTVDRLIMFGMWWIMMIAMMLPSAAPAILLAAATDRRSMADRPAPLQIPVFVAAFLLAWGGFSAVAVVLQWGFDRIGWINAMGVSVEPLLSGVLLVAAGLWQLTPLKRVALAHCRSPAGFLAAHRDDGVLRAFWAGGVYGVSSVIACSPLMLLLFIGGVMNLYWIIGLSVVFWFETNTSNGPVLSRWLGIGLLLAGIFLLTKVALPGLG